MEAGELNWIGLAAFVVLLTFYYFWGNARIAKQQKASYSRFDEFESSLDLNFQEYTCFTNNHPYVWGEVKYNEIKNEILASPHWKTYSTGPVPSRGYIFSLNSCEEKKYLYVATGSESFDWDSLCHYDAWKKRKIIYY